MARTMSKTWHIQPETYDKLVNMFSIKSMPDEKIRCLMWFVTDGSLNYGQRDMDMLMLEFRKAMAEREITVASTQ